MHGSKSGRREIARREEDALRLTEDEEGVRRNASLRSLLLAVDRTADYDQSVEDCTSHLHQSLQF